MNGKQIVYLVCIMMMGNSLFSQQTRPGKMAVFIDELMAKMTLEEKLGQLNLPTAGDFTTGQAANTDIAGKIKDGKVGGLFNIKSVAKIREVQRIAVEESRLKIPLLFGMDVIHGYETTFPIPLAMSCSWDMKLIEQSARIAAIEASADGINWTFSPMVDISRDPRWGRVSEGSGEDPYLGGQIAKAMVKGYQGNLTKDNEIMACVKHFALYGASEAGRDYNTTDMSHQRMYNEYFYPYRAAVEVGVASVMTSFNEVDGIPASGNKWLMTEVLRNQWGFEGFIVTDYTAINEMTNHGMGDLKTVSAMTLNAGVDMDMVGEGFLTTLARSLDEGKITMAQIDLACRRILEAKYRLGLFNDPFRFCNPERAKQEIFTPEHRDIARKIAAETFVLLKNENKLLPLKKEGTIGLIGPLADNNVNMPGTWSVASVHANAISVRSGLSTVLGDQARLLYAKGANLSFNAEYEARATLFGKTLNRDPRPPIELVQEALKVAEQSDVIVAVLGESAEMSGESSSRTELDIPDAQKELLRALLKTGKPVVLVLFAGRPMTLTWEEENVPAILNVWFAGSEAGLAIADVLFGDVNPSGKLTASFPKNVGQIPLFYNHKNTGRPLGNDPWFQKFRSNYLDVDNEPLYPFGYGLSYTTFDYSDIRVSATSLKGNQTLTASVQLINSGKRTGSEIIQLYIRDMVGSVTRPVKELKGFKKVTLDPGQMVTVSFEVTPEDLMFYNYDLIRDWESGEFEIMIGRSSADVRSAKVNWMK